MRNSFKKNIHTFSLIESVNRKTNENARNIMKQERQAGVEGAQYPTPVKGVSNGCGQEAAS